MCFSNGSMYTSSDNYLRTSGHSPFSPPSAHQVFVGPHKHKLVAHKMIFVIDIWISNRETGYSNVPHKHTPRTLSTLSAFTWLIHACASGALNVQVCACTMYT